MKKVIFILLTLIMFVNVVKAETLTEEIGEWQEEKIEGTNVELQYRYRFYKDIEVGDYIRIGQVSEYDYEDKENIIYGEYSNYQTYCEEKIAEPV